MAQDPIVPLVTIILPDGRTIGIERRRGDPLRRYAPPRPPHPQERRRWPRRFDAASRGHILDLCV
jgi:hypothetical protein